MATATDNKPLPTVLRWSGYAKVSGAKWGIPPAVLLAVTHHETRGEEGLISSAGAKGVTQFLDPTARTYGVNTNPGHAASQIDGAAHYLHDLGFATDPHKALASYAAGPGNWQAGVPYADAVLNDLVPLYGAGPGKSTTSASTSSTPTTSNPLAGTTGLIGSDGQPVVKLLLTVGFVLLGAALTWAGVNQLTGGALNRGAGVAAKAGAAAAA